MKPFDLLFQDSPSVAFFKEKLGIKGDFPMSKKSAMMNKLTGKRPLQALTRKQQVAALRSLKAEEVAVAVGADVRHAVRAEVAVQLDKIKTKMLFLIDQVMELEKAVYPDESNCADRQQGAEASKVPGDPEVVQGSGVERSDSYSPLEEGDTLGG